MFWYILRLFIYVVWYPSIFIILTTKPNLNGLTQQRFIVFSTVLAGQAVLLVSFPPIELEIRGASSLQVTMFEVQCF